MSSIALRPATARDAEAISRLLTELGHPASAAEIPARLEAITADGGATLLAVNGADEPLGFIAMASHAVPHEAGRVGYITALVTTAAARGKGVGRALVAAAREWAVQRGCVRLSVTSAEHRADAHAFYPACGMPYSGRRFSEILTPKR